MTLTTDELRQIVETDHVQCGDAAAMARELLANREAQPVACDIERIKRHALPAGECPRQSRVVLLSSLQRLLTAPPAPANANPVAWEMRYWNSGHNMWHDWERVTAEQHTEMSAEHAADNDYEFRVLYDAPPALAAFPEAKDKSHGWKIDPEYLHAIADAVGSSDDEGTPSMEMVEAVLLAAAPPAPAVPEEIITAPIDAMRCGPAASYVLGWNACLSAMLENIDKPAPQLDSVVTRHADQPVSGGYTLPEGFKLVPVESTDAWAERYCELTNKHPDGGLTTYIGDGAVTITFREKSKREIDAMLAAAPEGGNDHDTRR
ncbi:hypothetical protein [Serratia marcescens]|uniref:hypothetical protein n=1 Tax=Serratia marcescens TaxID=615 RepID=UPI00387A0BC4